MHVVGAGLDRLTDFIRVPLPTVHSLQRLEFPLELQEYEPREGTSMDAARTSLSDPLHEMCQNTA